MLDIKNDFPIFQNNPGLIFLDSGASAQKPQYVIDGVNEYISHDYANIHRGQYSLSEKSDDMYHASKEIVAKHLNCSSRELFYTYNSTYWINIIADSLAFSWFFQKGDVIVVWIREHNANVVPWDIIAKQYELEIKYLHIKEDYSIDWDYWDEIYDERVKLVTFGHVSNVSGQIYDPKDMKSRLRDDTFFIVDASQSVPHFAVDVKDIDCDALVFTGHKLFTYSGVGLVYLKKKWVKTLQTSCGGGGTVKNVSEDGVEFLTNIEKFEAGTPNIIWAASTLKAFEYLEQIGWYDAIQKHEDVLMNYALKKFESMKDKIRLLWTYEPQNRVWIFSFTINDMPNHNTIGETFAENNICIRCGGHCAHLLHHAKHFEGTCRVSLYVYNSIEDLDKFFEVLESLIK